MFCPVIALVAVSYLYNPQQWKVAPDWCYWVFALTFVFFVFACIALPHQFFIELSSSGFVIHRLWNQQSYCWNEVSNFRLASGPGHSGNRVVWEFATDSPHRTALIKTTSAMLGYDASLPDWFELPASKLANLLNEWQAAYGSASNEPD